MQIRVGPHTPSAGAPFPGESAEQMTPVARLDDTLAAGRLPEGLVPRDRHDWFPSFPVTADMSTWKAQMEDRSGPAAADRKRYMHRMLGDTAIKAVIGAVVGGCILSASATVSPFLMAAGGAAAAALYGWRKWHRHEQGTVSVDNDGVQRKTKFHFNPKHYDQTPQELRTVLLSQDVLGDRIHAAARPAVSDVDPARLAALKPHLGTLQELDADRRLVAALGNRSAYGHDVLDLVDADTARKLMAAGKPVFVVNGEGVQDVPHRLSVDARSPDRQRINIEAHDYTERQFNYSLTPLKGPEDFPDIAPADGLPQGMTGVYRHAGQVSAPVYRQSQEDARELGKTRNTHAREDFEQASAADVARGGRVGTVITHHLNFRAIGTLLGAAAGEVLGLALVGSGAPGIFLACVAGLGFAGHVIGEKLGDSRFGRIGTSE